VGMCFERNSLSLHAPDCTGLTGIGIQVFTKKMSELLSQLLNNGPSTTCWEFSKNTGRGSRIVTSAPVVWWRASMMKWPVLNPSPGHVFAEMMHAISPVL